MLTNNLKLNDLMIVDRNKLNDLLMTVDLLCSAAESASKYNTILFDASPLLSETVRNKMKMSFEKQHKYLLSQIEKYVNIAHSIQGVTCEP